MYFTFYCYIKNSISFAFWYCNYVNSMTPARAIKRERARARQRESKAQLCVSQLKQSLEMSKSKNNFAVRGKHSEWQKARKSKRSGAEAAARQRRQRSSCIRHKGIES